MTPDASPFRLGALGGAGPALLCLHGLTGTPYEVRPPAEALAERGFACVGPVLPGHLESPELLAVTRREEWVEAALGAFDALAKTHARVYLLGLSLGGLLALAVAARRPAAGLVVLAAPLRLSPWVRWSVPLLAGWLGSLPKTPAIADPAARARHPGYPRMPLRAVRELLRLQGEVAEDLGLVRAPTQLIFSRGDPTVPVRNAELIAGRIGSSECRIEYLDRSAHVITVDLEQTEVVSCSRAFLLGLEKVAGTVDPTRA